MFNHHRVARTISESQEVQRIVDNAALKYDGFENAWLGLTWLLARQADAIGTEYKGVRLYKTKGIEGGWTVPDIVVLYRVTEDEVEVVSLNFFDP